MVMNLIVLALFIAIYLVTYSMYFVVSGLGGVLVIGYLAFLIVSIYDAIYDRISDRKKPTPSGPGAEPKTIDPEN